MDKLYQIRIDVPEGQEYGRVMPIGDIHYGSRSHDSKMFEIYMNWIYKNKDVYVLGMSDLVENSNKNSVGYYDQIVDVNDQVDYIIGKFQPLQDEGRLIGLLEGNHERRTKKASGIDLNRQIVNQLNAINLGIAATLQIKVVPDKGRGEKYTFYAKHGSSGATTVGGRANAVVRMAKEVNAECYLMGHMHTLEHHKTYHYNIRYNKLVLTEKHYVITGSYMHYLGNYAQEKGYPPSGVSGSPKIKLHTDLHRISVSL